ncbi:hypothetical protein HET73_05505 [Wolbachia endosymbiont of Atemnus politus]|uniref:hypothetical protein n=1 Tax=Wolbachia endosymbiont of Atemnus politus TaxID=2682840 RepID=UPI001572DD52|nr:hypothetical protein [Wolbachia endosymbiont of Atemnus politus]NSM56820.1 hypothetical protein [Wolbachia endosymbiont of Atemnus politus]
MLRNRKVLESEIIGLNREIGQLKIQLQSEEELYDKLEEKGGDKNEELEKKITKEIEDLKACLNKTSKNINLYKQNKEHSSENSNVDRVFLISF